MPDSRPFGLWTAPAFTFSDMALIIIAVSLFIWLFCIGIAIDIANGKGNDVFVAGCLGLLFGPIGPIITGVMPPNESALAERRRVWTIQQIQSGRLIQCPHCRSTIPPARVCRVCGRETGKVCPKCQAFNPPDYVFCGNCGFQFTLRETPQGKETLTMQS